MLLIGNFHRRLGYLEGRLFHLQTVQPPEHFLVHGLAEFIMVFPQDNNRAVRVCQDLVVCADGRIAGFRSGTARGQYNVLDFCVIEYFMVLRDDDL